MKCMNCLLWGTGGTASDSNFSAVRYRSLHLNWETTRSKSKPIIQSFSLGRIHSSFYNAQSTDKRLKNSEPTCFEGLKVSVKGLRNAWNVTLMRHMGTISDSNFLAVRPFPLETERQRGLNPGKPHKGLQWFFHCIKTNIFKHKFNLNTNCII